MCVGGERGWLSCSSCGGEGVGSDGGGVGSGAKVQTLGRGQKLRRISPPLILPRRPNFKKLLKGTKLSN